MRGITASIIGLVMVASATPSLADPPVCNALGDLFNAVTLQPSCYERIRKYNFAHSQRAVVDLADIFGPHSPDHPSENYVQVYDTLGTDGWERTNRGY
jgi:hypothetical protein